MARKEPVAAACAHCGSTFEPVRATKSCSPECARAIKLAYDRTYNATRECAKWDRSNRICPQCGVEFSPAFVGQIYHDQACMRRARRSRERARGTRRSDIHRSRAKKYGREYEPISPAKVFERDGWICQICLKRVPKNKKAPHPRSPTLDHIIPMSRPGGDHLYTNVRLAHFECNWKRGADDESPVQLALFG
jgi:5-methylcytosine-specific restriction endonuclease McrA